MDLNVNTCLYSKIKNMHLYKCTIEKKDVCFNHFYLEIDIFPKQF